MRITLASIKSNAERQPDRIILYSVEGWGKTSFGAQFPKPIFLMSKGETGLLKLIDRQQLPQTPHFPEIETWAELYEALNIVAKEDLGYQTIVLDVGGGFERLCHEFVCDRDYGGNWGERGFARFQVGYDHSLADWRKLLFQCLDALRMRKGMDVVVLCHVRKENFSNPEGADYSRYVADMHRKTWGVTVGWADMVLFGNYRTFVEEERPGKGKAQGGVERVIYTQRTASYDAKQRHGLPNEIILGNTPELAYKAFRDALNAVETKPAMKVAG